MNPQKKKEPRDPTGDNALEFLVTNNNARKHSEMLGYLLAKIY